MKLRSLCMAVLGTLMVSESAFALSCARPEVVTTLEDAKTSEKLYHILVGKFITTSPRPKNSSNSEDSSRVEQFKPKPPVITRAYFEGYSLAKHRRMDQPLTRFPVDVETSCVGPWCSGVPSSDRDLIAFVEAREGQPPLLKISPCPYWTFNAEPKQVRKVRQCLDKTCEVEAPDW